MEAGKILGVDKDMMKGYVIVLGIMAVGIGLILFNAHRAHKESLIQTED